MKILVINNGSSSLKYQLIDPGTEQAVCKGLCERIGIEGGKITHKTDSGKYVFELSIPTHTDAFHQMLSIMTKGEGAVVKSKDEIAAVGHRIAHGGEQFDKSAVITDEIFEMIEATRSLAPLHIPAHVQGVRIAREIFGAHIPQVAVFDTAFHQTMPPRAYIYPIPYRYYTDYAIRRYGFHGTSHRYVSAKAASFLNRPIETLKIVTCHLGNGSSLAAIKCGVSIDTSMGLTPLGGIMMGTRSGDIDPGVLPYIAEVTGKNLAEIDGELNKQSGFLGVSGLSSDNRDVEIAAANGHKMADLAQEICAYQISKFIGAYAAAMGGLDCVVFTGGIGEHSSDIRERACQDLGFLGIKIDGEKNAEKHPRDISLENSAVRTLVIPTDEEMLIALDTYAVLKTSI